MECSKDKSNMISLSSFSLSFSKMSLNDKENDDKKERIKRLKEHLNISKVKHEIEIMKELTLKEAHIYCVLQNVSAQQYGPLLEKYIILKNNFKKNNSSECIGDCSKGNDNVEIKTSLGGSNHIKFNFVQLRINQKINYYLFTAYHLIPENIETEGELYIFRIPKNDIKNIIISHGGYAHGTIKEHGKITIETLNDEKNMKEYAFRPTFNDECWKELLKFRILENEI